MFLVWGFRLGMCNLEHDEAWELGFEGGRGIKDLDGCALSRCEVTRHKSFAQCLAFIAVYVKVIRYLSDSTYTVCLTDLFPRSCFTISCFNMVPRIPTTLLEILSIRRM